METKKGITVPQLHKESADRELLKQESRDIAKALWAGKLTPNEQAAVNNICKLYNLDPLQKQIIVLGGNFYVTKSGILSIAHQDVNPPEGIELIPATKQEREDAHVPDDSHYWKAVIYKQSMAKSFNEFGEANAANVKLNIKDWRSISDMAKTRAVNRALRNAYRIGLTSLEEMGYEEGEIVNVVAEPESLPAVQPAAEPAPKNEPPAPPAKISEAQRKLLFVKIKEAGFTEEEFKDYLRVAHNLNSTKEIPADSFSKILTWLTGNYEIPNKE
jgi:hypothetical protein